jgi:hypothetical protein
MGLVSYQFKRRGNQAGFVAQWQVKGEGRVRVLYDLEDDLPLLFCSPDAALKAAKEALDKYLSDKGERLSIAA